MKIDYKPESWQATVGGGYDRKTRNWTPQVYQDIKPGDTVPLSFLPHGGVFGLHGTIFVFANAFTKTIHALDSKDEVVRPLASDTPVEYLGRTNLFNGKMDAGEAVRVLAPHKYAGQIYIVGKSGYNKIQCFQPNSARVIIERYYLKPVKAELKEII